MTGSQTFVVLWLQFVLAATAFFAAACIAQRWIRQPVDRIRLIQLIMIAAIGMPLITALAPWTVWRFEVFQEPRAVSPQYANHGQAVVNSQPASWALPAPAWVQGVASRPHRSSSVIEHDENVSRDASPATSLPNQINLWLWLAIGIIAVHTAALGYQGCEWLVGMLRLRAIIRSAMPADSQLLRFWNQVTQHQCEHVQLYVSSRIDTPFTCGWPRPVVVIPQQLDPSDLSAIRYCLVHEWSHIQRCDLVTWRALWACQFLFWYQPLFWRLRRELRICQDILADECAASGGDDVIHYSELLIQFAKNRQPYQQLAGALTFIEHPSQLMRRISMLLERPFALRAHCTWRFSFILSFVAILIIGALSGIRLDAARADDRSQNTGAGQATAPSAEKSAQTQVKKPVEEPRQATTDAKPIPDYERPAHLTYSCVVADRFTGEGLPNATVIVERQDSNQNFKVLAKTEHVTDANGNFKVEIPRDQSAVRSLYIQIRVRHDDYVNITGSGYSLAMIRKNETFGERPFFERIRLHPGQRVTGKVLSPNGEPVANAKISGFTAAKPRDFDNFAWIESTTDAEGSFRVNVIQDGHAFLWISTKQFAIAQRMVDKQGLGEIRLAQGQRIIGRVLSAEGNPVPGIAVNAWYNGQDNDPLNQFAVASGIRRGVMTDQEGRFTLDPLPSGEYRVTPDDELEGDDSRREPIPLPGVFVSRKVTLQENTPPRPLEIQGIPHIVFRSRYLTSAGKSTRGSEFWLSGQMDGEHWSTKLRPDSDGVVSAQIPHGLQNAQLMLITNEHSSLGVRRGPGKPIEKYFGNVRLGTLNDDIEGFEIIRYRAPIVLVRAVDMAGRPVRHFQLNAAYAEGTNEYGRGVSCERQDAETYRTSQMLPDEEVNFQVSATGYETTSENLKLAEGESQELVIKMKSISPAVDAVNTVVDGAADLLKALKSNATPKKE